MSHRRMIGKKKSWNDKTTHDFNSIFKIDIFLDIINSWK